MVEALGYSLECCWFESSPFQLKMVTFIGFNSKKQANYLFSLLASCNIKLAEIEQYNKNGWFYVIFPQTAETNALLVGFLFDKKFGYVRGTGRP